MPNTLSKNFAYAGWSIKYSVLDPSPSTSNEPVKTLIFVHGTPWSSAVFRPIAETLSTIFNYRILLYDLAGYGQSQSLDAVNTTFKAGFPGDTSVKAQAEILAALLAHLHLDEPAVIAHDIAGTIALRAHLIHGVNFESLMLWDTNAVLPWGDGFYKLCRANPMVFVQLPSPIFEAVVRAVTRSACAKPMPKYWEEILAQPWLEAQASFVRQIAQADDGDVREMLDGEMYGNVRCKVRILWGEQDGWIPKGKMEELAGLLGDKLDGLVTVPEAGHLLMVDQPERVMGEIVKWLG